MRHIDDIAAKVRRAERIDDAEAARLWREAPLWLLGELATAAKQRVSGDKVYYNRNFHIEPTNRCVFNCRFCSYRRPAGDPEAWDYTMDEIEQIARERQGKGITEVHIVGGVHPDHGLDYYTDMIRRVKAILPGAAVKAFTAIELSYMIRKAGLTTEEGLRQLKQAGMDAIPGGGAEIFDERIRQRICPEKGSTAEWLGVHEAAHRLGIPTNATILYGHVEELRHRINHLRRLRELQDLTGGFNAFIPLKYRNFGNPMSEIGEVSVIEDLRMLAMSRIYLDNIPHIKAYWVMYGKATTELALAFGADDIDGTIDDTTRIYSMAGAEDRKPSMSIGDMHRIVRAAGYRAVERDTFYNPTPNGETGILLETAPEKPTGIQPRTDRGDHPGDGRRGPHRHAGRHAPRRTAHGARLFGREARPGTAHGPQVRPQAAHQRLAVRAGLRRGHRPRPAARRGRGGQARPHGLHHDQLLPPEDGARALRGGTFAAAGQEHAGDRGAGDRRAGLPRRHGDQLRTGRILRRPPRSGDEQDRGRTGLGRDALCGCRRRLRHDGRTASGRVPAQGGQGPPVGTGAQRRQGGFRRRDQPPEPEGCPRLYPASHGRAERRAGLARRPQADARREETRPIPRHSRKAGEGGGRRAIAIRTRTCGFTGSGGVRTGGGRLRRGTAGRRACGSRKRRRIFRLMADERYIEEDPELDQGSEATEEDGEGAGLYEHFAVVADKGQTPLRLDKFLTVRMEKCSRNRIQAAADCGNILVNGKPAKSSYKVKPLDRIQIVMPYPRREVEIIPEDIPLEIPYEDDDLLIVNKPAGLVVHPGHGNYSGTLVNALTYHLRNLPLFQEGDMRAGLVHRIDKNTSGLLVVAKNEQAHARLAKQFFDHTIQRRYVALVWGNFDQDEGTITGNIGRSPRDRQKMFVFEDGSDGKHAVTHWRVLKRYGYVTLVECRLETGRTHQIRVHMSWQGHPLFNDERYGGDRILKGTTFSKYRQFVENCFAVLSRHALHARSLGFVHPTTRETVYFESELPADFRALLGKWETYAAASKETDNG